MTDLQRGVGKGRGRGDVGLPWTDLRVALLRKLMLDGLSASGIACEMGGVTRNGVIGKIHRLGLSNRKLAALATNIGGPMKPRMHQLFNERRAEELAMPPRATKPQPARVKIRPGANTSTSKEVERLDATEIIDLPPETSVFAVPIANLRHGMCRWPLGEPSAEMLYCGAASHGSWCPGHRAIVYVPLQRRRA